MLPEVAELLHCYQQSMTVRQQNPQRTEGAGQQGMSSILLEVLVTGAPELGPARPDSLLRCAATSAHNPTLGTAGWCRATEHLLLKRLSDTKGSRTVQTERRC